MLERLLARTRDLYRKALAEHASPGGIALAVALGTFCACTPLVGFHIWLALGLATAFRLNRLWAAVGSRATTPGLLPVVVFLEIEVAHRARFGVWAPLSPRQALAQGPDLLLDWVLGTLPVGAAYAALLGAVAYVLASRRAAVMSSTPAGPRPASSGSPPSAPPSPTP
ncbi:MAG: DUF2062 domain-containing protein [Polyangiaceae bacterium]